VLREWDGLLEREAYPAHPDEDGCYDDYDPEGGPPGWAATSTSGGLASVPSNRPDERQRQQQQQRKRLPQPQQQMRPPPRHTNTRYTPEETLWLADQYRTHWKGSQASFCRRYDISRGNFCNWLNGKKSSPLSAEAVHRWLADRDNGVVPEDPGVVADKQGGPNAAHVVRDDTALGLVPLHDMGYRDPAVATAATAAVAYPGESEREPYDDYYSGSRVAVSPTQASLGRDPTTTPHRSRHHPVPSRGLVVLPDGNESCWGQRRPPIFALPSKAASKGGSFVTRRGGSSSGIATTATTARAAARSSTHHPQQGKHKDE
jgi:hypothetical protein